MCLYFYWRINWLRWRLSKWTYATYIHISIHIHIWIYIYIYIPRHNILLPKIMLMAKRIKNNKNWINNSLASSKVAKITRKPHMVCFSGKLLSNASRNRLLNYFKWFFNTWQKWPHRLYGSNKESLNLKMSASGWERS